MSSIVSSITGQRTGNHGGAGLGFDASNTNILSPTTTGQADEQYSRSQDALDKQLQFLQAVQAQGGLNNQSNVFNQMQGVANGTGPNPAQAQLAQATGANVANQAALMAGQRGSSANAGMIARQAGMQGANIQQQAAGQGATLQAQQSLNAMNQMGSIANQQAAQQAAATGAYTGGTQGLQSNILNSIAQQNNANVGMQSNVNSANAGVSGAAAKGQMDLIGNVMGGAGSAMMAAEGGMVQKYAEGSPQGVQPAAPAAPGVKAGPKSSFGQAMQQMSSGQPPTQPIGMAYAGNSLGSAIGSGFKAGYNALFGAPAPEQVPLQTQNDQMFQAGRPDMMEGKAMAGAAEPIDVDMPLQAMDQDPNRLAAAGGGLLQKVQQFAPLMEALMAQGGRVPALVSPGERYLPPQEVKKVAQGDKNPMQAGKKIPGKPKVGGAKNSYANDTVPATLQEGGIVLPRSVTQSKNAPQKAKEFVAAVLARKGK